MITPNRIHDALKNPELEQNWMLTLSAWEEAVPSQIQATLAYVRGLRNQVLNVTRDVDDIEELERMLALCYLDLKCQWAILNAQIQYGLARRDIVREDLMFRATCVSQVLEVCEGLLSQTDVDSMTEMIAQPIAASAPQNIPAPPPLATSWRH